MSMLASLYLCFLSSIKSHVKPCPAYIHTACASPNKPPHQQHSAEPTTVVRHRPPMSEPFVSPTDYVFRCVQSPPQEITPAVAKYLQAAIKAGIQPDKLPQAVAQAMAAKGLTTPKIEDIPAAAPTSLAVRSMRAHTPVFQTTGNKIIVGRGAVSSSLSEWPRPCPGAAHHQSCHCQWRFLKCCR